MCARPSPDMVGGHRRIGTASEEHLSGERGVCLLRNDSPSQCSTVTSTTPRRSGEVGSPAVWRSTQGGVFRCCPYPTFYGVG
jgi:hypothetical protein